MKVNCDGCGVLLEHLFYKEIDGNRILCRSCYLKEINKGGE